jgi:hypothetical protein
MDASGYSTAFPLILPRAYLFAYKKCSDLFPEEQFPYCTPGQNPLTVQSAFPHPPPVQAEICVKLSQNDIASGRIATLEDDHGNALTGKADPYRPFINMIPARAGQARTTKLTMEQ